MANSYTETELDPSLGFFYQPHNISVLAISVLALVYFAFDILHEPDRLLDAKIGLWAAFGVLITTGLLNFKDGPFIRPHPLFWRVVLSFAVAYQMGLVFLLFQSKDSARDLFKFVDPALGVKPMEKIYAANCELTAENIYDQLDIFVVAHVVGWIAKALILRDYWLCWVISVLFELMEYTLAHHLPNFNECWWDHWILDALLSNWLGIVIGNQLVNYFEMKVYAFRNLNKIKSVKEKVKRTLGQFLPYSFSSYHWNAGNFSNFAAVLGLIIVEIGCELNAFYLKYLLYIPVESNLNAYRLIYYFFICAPAVREYYQYLTDPKCKRLGMFAFFAVANVVTELLLIIKLSRDEFPNSMPTEIATCWIIVVLLLAGYSLYRFGAKRVHVKSE